MPRINILKVDRPVCEHCGKRIEDITYCHIETATGKEIKMHRECAKDFAVSILEAFNEDKDLRSLLDMVVKMHVVHTPKAHFGESEGDLYVYYDCFNIISLNGCKTCSAYCYNTKEDRHECSKAHCSLRDGERE